jgi:hypothetical protein
LLLLLLLLLVLELVLRELQGHKQQGLAFKSLREQVESHPTEHFCLLVTFSPE